MRDITPNHRLDSGTSSSPPQRGCRVGDHGLWARLRGSLWWFTRRRIYRVLRGDQLPCGCVAGVYELYNGDILSVIDARAEGCRDPLHKPGIVVSRDSGSHSSEA